MSIWLERLAIVIASLILSIGLIAVLSGFFAGRDQAGVSGTGSVAGQQFKDLGHAQLRPGEPRPAYNSNPPTSGAHIPVPVTADPRDLSDDQLLQGRRQRRDRAGVDAVASCAVGERSGAAAVRAANTGTRRTRPLTSTA